MEKISKTYPGSEDYPEVRQIIFKFTSKEVEDALYAYLENREEHMPSDNIHIRDYSAKRMQKHRLAFVGERDGREVVFRLNSQEVADAIYAYLEEKNENIPRGRVYLWDHSDKPEEEHRLSFLVTESIESGC